MNKFLFLLAFPIFFISCSNEPRVFYDTAKKLVYLDSVSNKNWVIKYIDVYSGENKKCDYSSFYDSLKIRKVDLTSAMTSFDCDTVSLTIEITQPLEYGYEGTHQYYTFFYRKDKPKVIEATLMHL